MAGFKPGSFGFGRDHSPNGATTTAQQTKSIHERNQCKLVLKNVEIDGTGDKWGQMWMR